MRLRRLKRERYSTVSRFSAVVISSVTIDRVFRAEKLVRERRVLVFSLGKKRPRTYLPGNLPAKYFPGKTSRVYIYICNQRTEMRMHNRGYPEESATCRNNYSLMFSLSSQYSHAIAFLTCLLPRLRIITSCFGGRLPRLRKPKYFILREARGPLCQDAGAPAL